MLLCWKRTANVNPHKHSDKVLGIAHATYPMLLLPKGDPISSKSDFIPIFYPHATRHDSFITRRPNATQSVYYGSTAQNAPHKEKEFSYPIALYISNQSFLTHLLFCLLFLSLNG
ncbi:hypothetical protein N7495_004840 [Penicillium taxi]|uniref:uncharacterized protein n=1 Tax=Penicillium taxi TaxID=168475 RepID=UPI002545B18A|nr:uncharacterized protein N7495_004840 [Penicillium taxi]KAJ5900096.1 hypothetical protein N7495_004840 [Penicillium taxi]